MLCPVGEDGAVGFCRRIVQSGAVGHDRMFGGDGAVPHENSLSAGHAGPSLGGGKRANIAEIPAALGKRRHRLIEIRRRTLEAELFREEKVRLVLTVIKSRDQYGTTQGGSEVISPVKRRFRGLVKIIARIEELVADELIGIPVELVSARLGFRQNRT